MRILDRIRNARDNFRIENQRKAQTSALQNKLDLEDAKIQRETLRERISVRNELNNERKQIRELQHPTLAKVKNILKESTRKGSQIAGKKIVQAHNKFLESSKEAIATNKTIGNSPFYGQNIKQSASPFAPGNANKLLGKATPKQITTKRKKSRNTIIVIRK